MYVTTNSAGVWKQKAVENGESARTIGRIAIGLFVLLLAVGAYAFSAHNSLESVCAAVERSAAKSSAKALNDLAHTLATDECA